jgi:alpha-glucosidase (family GH31 glycosyl hydrolase)
MSASTLTSPDSRFRLELTHSPFALTIFRGTTPTLSLAPHTEPMADWVIQEHTARVEFPSSTLELSLRDNQLRVEWRSRNPQSPITVRFPLTTPWYGLGQLLHQRWPLNKVMLPEAPLLTSDNGPTGLACILTPAWLSASGVAVLARPPISTGLNQPPTHYPQHAWDLSSAQAPFDERPWADPGGLGDGHLSLTSPQLRFEVLLGDDLLSAFRLLIAELGHPAGTPPAELFTRPTWTTWARYKTQINHTVVLNYAREIVNHGYPHHVLEIDDKWQSYYGDYEFDPAKFPDARGLIAELHRMGFAVTAWVHPFVEPGARAMAEGAAQGYLVRAASGAPYHVPWWQGRGGLLDVSNPRALEWFFGNLRRLQAETGLDGYKFDAGEGLYLPADAVTHAPMERNEYAQRYVDAIAQHYALCEVRSGWFNQRAPVFFRQWDKSTHWTHANGLRSVIPGALSLSLTGYPFVLPDMIGGNAYAEQADAELMIRWTQLTALLPAMQFSLAPWDYGEHCAAICRRYAELHTLFAPRIVQLAQAAARTGEPIVRPVFWLAPQDENALRCDDEFLLGDDVLVAPVVEPGARRREVYLPPGLWRDYWTSAVFSGPVTLSGFAAPLEVLPLFERSGNAM